MTARTVAWIAEHLGVSEDTVYGWLHSGELVGRNLGLLPDGRKNWRVLDADLEAFLDGRRSAPPPAPRRRQRAPAVTEYF